MNNNVQNPSSEQINLLPPFERLGMEGITLVNTAEGVARALTLLGRASAWGFDTESKPTFLKDQVSDGPHIVQLATRNHAWVFQLHDAACRHAVAQLLTMPGIVKAGFGLGDDNKRILTKLGVQICEVLELNSQFRALGYRKEIGVKGAVAVLFAQRFIKSKKAATSNWAKPSLSETQLVYAANDAYAALCVHEALGSPLPSPLPLTISAPHSFELGADRSAL